MNCYSSVSQYIYIHIGSTVVEELVCYERGSWFETSDQQGIFFLFGIFNVQNRLVKNEIHGIHDNKLFEKNITAKPIIVSNLTLIRICLVMRSQNKYKNM